MTDLNRERFAVTVCGDDMAPAFEDGDKLICCPATFEADGFRVGSYHVVGHLAGPIMLRRCLAVGPWGRVRLGVMDKAKAALTLDYKPAEVQWAARVVSVITGRMTSGPARRCWPKGRRPPCRRQSALTGIDV